MEKTKYKIGEFSKLARVTVRTLRHYEDIGLIKPDIVDKWTGYRYYSPGAAAETAVHHPAQGPGVHTVGNH